MAAPCLAKQAFGERTARSQYLLEFGAELLIARCAFAAEHDRSLSVDDNFSTQGHHFIGPDGRVVGILGPQDITSSYALPETYPFVKGVVGGPDVDGCYR